MKKAVTKKPAKKCVQHEHEAVVPISDLQMAVIMDAFAQHAFYAYEKKKKALKLPADFVEKYLDNVLSILRAAQQASMIQSSLEHLK